jgi:CRISPR-associated protein Cas1
MGEPLIDTIVSERRLRQAWARVKANGAAAGVDGVSIGEFESRLDCHLAKLRFEVLSNTYKPLPLRRLSIAKHDGKQRLLAIPCVADRLLQTAVAIVLDELLDPVLSDASFGYRRGRSVEHAVGRVMTYRWWGRNWAAAGDIEACFDSIPHGRLLSELEALIGCRRTLAVIAQWLRTCAVSGSGIAQGSPLSPLLANLYLDPIDKAIHRKRVRLVRFADDFVLLTRTQAGARWARERMEQLLAAKELRLNPEKTRIVSFSEGFEFLGYVIKDHCAVVRRFRTPATAPLG